MSQEDIGRMYCHCVADIQLSKNSFLQEFRAHCPQTSGRIPQLVENFIEKVDARLSQFQKEMIKDVLIRDPKKTTVPPIPAVIDVAPTPLVQVSSSIDWYKIGGIQASLRRFLSRVVERLLIMIRAVHLHNNRVPQDQRRRNYENTNHQILHLKCIRFNLPRSATILVTHLQRNKFAHTILTATAQNFVNAFHFTINIQSTLLEFWHHNEQCRYLYCPRDVQIRNEHDLLRLTKSMRGFMESLYVLL